MRRLLLLPVLALVALFLAATPASAATVDSFTIEGSTANRTATVGDELAWSVTTTGDDPDTLVIRNQTGSASDNSGVQFWGGEAGGSIGTGTSSGTFDVVEPGTYTFSITASEEGQDDETSQVITVTVLPAEDDPTEIPVPDITFPDTCTVVLPETANVTFSVGFGNFGNDVEPGTYDLSEFYNSGFPITFGAAPAEGFAFPEGATTFVEVTPSADCFPQLVRVNPICQAIEFTNTTDNPVLVQFGVIEEEEADSEFELAPGATRTVGTERDNGVFTVNLDPETLEVDQAGPVTIDQDCTPAGSDDAAPANAAFPTKAPAAGSDQSPNSTPGVLAAVALLGAALVGGRRLLRSA